MVVKSTLACGLQKSIGNLWKGDDFSDFTVVVEDTTFKCHRFILSACSSFFQGLFKSKLKECQENKATVGGMTASTFDVILNSMYKGTECLTEDNVLDVWSATVQLQIAYLAEECENYVMENLSVDSCFIVLTHATMYSAKRVVDHTLDFISKHGKWVNRECLLQLPYDYFYKIIENDYLVASSEDVVLEVVLKWVEYTPSLRQGSEMSDVNITSDAGINDSLEETEIISQSVGSQSKSYVDKSAVSRVTEDREQHLFQLISACRLYVINPKYLETILTNNKLLRSCKQAYNLIFEAMMYGLNVERRHDAWPDLAVHRMSSSLKHVMVFVYNDRCMLYNLNKTSKSYFFSVFSFAKIPGDFKANKTITVFDNNLYLDYVDKDGQVLSIFTTEKSWQWINFDANLKNSHSFMVAHGSCIYGLLGKKLDCCRVHGDVRQWSVCCELNQDGNCLVRFTHYIIVFYTENRVVTAQCYNTETKKLHVGTTTMGGTAKDLTSFSHHGDVFILQRNGSLWKIVSSYREHVDFELISKLWDQEYNLRGCVVYKKQLFVFFLADQEMEVITFLKSLPGIFNCIKLVAVRTDTLCFPMVIPQAFFYPWHLELCFDYSNGN